MINIVRSIRVQLQQPQSLFSAYLTRQGHSIVKFRPASTFDNSEPDSMNMDKTQNHAEKTGDLMSHSFGEGYASRSDEEGFGGIYGGNQAADIDKEDRKINENHPDYDKSQGSEVKEKEKARHQTQVS